MILRYMHAEGELTGNPFLHMSPLCVNVLVSKAGRRLKKPSMEALVE